MSPDLPPALRQAADRLLEGVSRKGLAEQSARISAQYRAGQTSAGVVGSAADATAYVLTRLPATYAAGAHVLAEAARIAPGFAPMSLLDAGAGPGGASWAALETWPGVAAATLLDSNRSFLDMAQTLAAGGPAALRDAQRLRGDLTAPQDWPAADLVVASYALAEIAPARQAGTIAALWASTLGMLVLIEPGTPAGHGRILTAREGLIAAGATILGPCPHHAPCPLVAPDWCHFVQRLPRSRDHRLAKGGEVPFEDEKFIYLVAARPAVAAGRREARILAPPHAVKPGITFKLCTPEGTAAPRFVPRRDKPAYAAARHLGWGDVLPAAE
ncbi:small ribosomal subunit Rsm22 family protein [Phenylobacterium sp.]|uniref:small ribosomal subunit Rsm22 family protein n=1 Tax=Phenylobacterium sp. TaxID=1871053 RepID=UPI00273719E4|nr:small ribosomal subunit Rsm22 family protein [Phenylobacterium sp.]MDP3855933.1 small ribosomal subunit Rsm22 family protein [Phenylobacterium sp.]